MQATIAQFQKETGVTPKAYRLSNGAYHIVVRPQDIGAILQHRQGNLNARDRMMYEAASTWRYHVGIRGSSSGGSVTYVPVEVNVEGNFQQQVLNDLIAAGYSPEDTRKCFLPGLGEGAWRSGAAFLFGVGHAIFGFGNGVGVVDDQFMKDLEAVQAENNRRLGISGSEGKAIQNGCDVWTALATYRMIFGGAVDPGDESLPNCFPPETLVATETGPRPIREVDRGDRVWGYDFQSGKWSLCEVERRHDSTYNGLLVTLGVGNDEVTATLNHPFWVVEGEGLADRPAPHRLGATKTAPRRSLADGFTRRTCEREMSSF